jgi:hypothetical protein
MASNDVVSNISTQKVIKASSIHFNFRLEKIQVIQVAILDFGP